MVMLTFKKKKKPTVNFNRNFLRKLNISPILLWGGGGFKTIQAWSLESLIFWLTKLDDGTKTHLILKPHLQSGV